MRGVENNIIGFAFFEDRNAFAISTVAVYFKLSQATPINEEMLQSISFGGGEKKATLTNWLFKVEQEKEWIERKISPVRNTNITLCADGLNLNTQCVLAVCESKRDIDPSGFETQW